MSSTIQLPDKPSEKFPRYFVSTGDATCIIQFNSPRDASWVEPDGKWWPSSSTIYQWEKWVKLGKAKELTEAEAKALLQNHGL